MASFNPPIQYEIGDWIEFPTYHGMLAAFTYIHDFLAFLHFVSKQVRCCLFSMPHPTFSSGLQHPLDVVDVFDPVPSLDSRFPQGI